MFKPRPLPWKATSFPGFLTEESIHLQYDVYLDYLKEINLLAITYPNLQKLTLAEIVDQYTENIQSIASQILNYEFFFENISPTGGNPGGRMYQLINNNFSSYDSFISTFNQIASHHVGSGWIWLIYNTVYQQLEIIDGQDTYNPILNGYIPLMVLNIWEPNDQEVYVQNFWNYVNWNMADKILSEEVFGDYWRIQE